ncbi:MAG: hypothetical protein DYG94_00650 [Leptolyngbya sp. PLA3]|nr:MAG: hypothetical protein EDM82_01225 [Cyanobacteria bacterium CYA]MCE7967243.1 hypothetical protein [Leptolyngbya sp. PL-A3]
MRGRLLAAVVGVLAGSAYADLLNGDIESNSSGMFGAIDFWGPNGGWADHAGFARPGNAGLGLYFGFYSGGLTETVGQVSSMTFAAGQTYTFSSWATGGGNDTGVISYEIGYDGGGGNFVQLAVATYDLTGLGMWVQTAGVSHAVGSGGAEIGRNIWVRLGDGTTGSSDDIWFDNLTLVPSPGAMATLALGGLALARRRR